MPVNYRYDPFAKILQAVNKTDERHTVPAASPFWIKLFEVPKKDNPSTLKIRVVSSLTAAITTTGQTSITVANGSWFTNGNTITIDSEKMLVGGVSGNTLTVTRAQNGTTATTHLNGASVYIENSMSEVSSTPTAGQFWPDYSTGADNDANWNTGTIAFNEADAGKAVSVNYVGIGTLADDRAINHGSQVFTASGTFTVPAGVFTVYVSQSGGGAGGGKSETYPGSGGGGAHAVLKQPVSVTPETNINITIGAAGTGATSGSATSGGTTSFGAFISCPGGSAGVNGINTNAPGGASGGIGGSKGQDATTRGGDGGGSIFGQPGYAGSGAGVNGSGYGAGGSGATSGNGGNGSPGICIVEW